jgi:hypothetical protein
MPKRELGGWPLEWDFQWAEGGYLMTFGRENIG